MKPEEIAPILSNVFTSNAVQSQPPDSWQVELPDMRLLVLLSDDQSWLRILVPLVPAQEAQPYLEQLLEANFDRTQEVRYAFNQGVLWGVFQHALESLIPKDFESAIARLVLLREQGLTDAFNQLAEQRLRQIIAAAKLQGQTLEATLKSLDRMYEEGMLGSITQDPEERRQFLQAWEYQLTRLWPEVKLFEE